MERQIWQHKTSGEMYIVDLDGVRIVAAIGPASHSDIGTLWRGGYEPDREAADALAAFPAAYVAVRVGGPVRYISSVLDPSIKEDITCS